MENKTNQSNATSVNVAPIARKPTDLKNPSTYEEFILWFALPRHEKVKNGLETMEQFASYHSLSARTLNRWKLRPDFMPMVKDLRMRWGQSRTSDMIAAMYNSGMKGNPLAQKLWFQVIEGWSEKTETKVTTGVEIGVNDIRFLIELFPENEREKYYAYITEIVERADFLRNGGLLEDRVVPTGESQEALLGEADSDASETSNKATNEVAIGYSHGLRCDMVWSIPAYHHEGASRRRKEPTAGDGGL